MKQGCTRLGKGGEERSGKLDRSRGPDWAGAGAVQQLSRFGMGTFTRNSGIIRLCLAFAIIFCQHEEEDEYFCREYGSKASACNHHLQFSLKICAWRTFGRNGGPLL